MAVMTAACLVYNKPAKTKIAFALFLLFLVAGFFVSASAPGNKVRQESMAFYSGIYQSSPIWAITQSFSFARQYLVGWMGIRIISVLLFLTPLFYKMARRINYSFAAPLLVVFFSFCLFAAHFTPTFYAMSMLPQGRAMNIIYYAFVLLTFFNYFYLVGWAERIVQKYQINLSREFLTECAAMAGVFALFFLLASAFGIREHSAYIAAKDLISGTAKQYSEEMNSRYKILHDDRFKQIELPPLTVRPKSLFFDDLTTDRDDWRNYQTAWFYQKNYIIINENLNYISRE
jgi:hypothetical protein